MKKAIVTGAAGFIGSHLCESLLNLGYQVDGIDSFTDYYDPALKESNICHLKEQNAFRLHRADLNDIPLEPLLDGTDIVFHQAAQAGVRSSWGDEFDRYTRWNIMATQRLLEKVRQYPVRRVVIASSSSVYGDTTDLPVTEQSATWPHSPYGVTKLAAEHLGRLYRRNFGVPTVALRYFTVYGPRQRPDMAFRRLIEAAERGLQFGIYGTGEQSRDFTYVQDTVDANLLAASAEDPSAVYNVGGGARISLNESIELIESITGHEIKVERTARQKGDVRDTWADTSRAEQELGFRPKIAIREGLERMVEWYRTGPGAA